MAERHRHRARRDRRHRARAPATSPSRARTARRRRATAPRSRARSTSSIDSAKSAANAQYAGRYVFSGTLDAHSRRSPHRRRLPRRHRRDLPRDRAGRADPRQRHRATPCSATPRTALIKALRDVQRAPRTPTTSDALSQRPRRHRHGARGSRHRTHATSGRARTGSTRRSRVCGELEETTTTLLSNTEDADMAKTLIDASTQQAVYQSALRAGAHDRPDVPARLPALEHEGGKDA